MCLYVTVFISNTGKLLGGALDFDMCYKSNIPRVVNKKQNDLPNNFAKHFLVI